MMKHRRMSSASGGVERPGGRGRGRRGFTLLEMLIAIGAVLIVAVGLSQIFRAAADTLRIGRKVSAINSYAMVVERQLREDVSRMSRAGFLLVRNEQAQQGTAIGAGAEDEKPRVRRVDELVFFAEGEFTTRRDAVHPDRVLKSNEAMVYVGHGLRQDFGDTGYAALRLNDPNTDAAPFGEKGSNRYAKDWSLLRHATLLRRPGLTRGEPLRPDDPPPGLPSAGLADSVVQVDLQPAAVSVFRNLALNESIAGATSVRGAAVRPALASGLVDAATIDLAQVRSVVRSAVAQNNVNYPFVVPNSHASGPTAVRAMQDWMLQALPANSYQGPVTARTRVRFESSPPDLLGVSQAKVLKDYERADQVMLTASALVPGCGEFIVEWSLGDTETNGDLRWHGLERFVDMNRNGTFEANERVCEPYSDADQTVIKIEDLDGNEIDYPVRAELMHRQGPIAGSATELVSTFGFTDPSWQPLNAEDPETVAWPWPTMLRVTFTVTDPSGSGEETEFQYVFKVPGGGVPPAAM